MTDTSRPITPTRVIPAGAPLPPRPPDPDEEPPWWHQRKAPAPPSPRAPAPAAPPEPPPPIQVHVTVDLTPVEEAPLPTRTQRVVDWLWDRCTDWKLLSAVLAALAPWLAGTSPAGAWAATLHDARAEAGLLAAYLLAAAALGITWAINRRGRWAGRFAFTVAFVGALGVLDPYDLVYLLTGVPR